MSNVLETVLLLALPASGKSEVRKYLASLTPAQCADDFHMGPTVQLDDFPYVHLMRRIDDEAAARGAGRIYFQAGDRPFLDPRDWGTLIALLNEDHAHLVGARPAPAANAALALFDRLERASAKVGIAPRLPALADAVRAGVAAAIEREARDLEADLAKLPTSLAGKTLVIEFARGGADGSAMPLEAPFGYGHSLGLLSPAILEKATILYVWVTPEESRRKNTARTDPNDPGSILNHGVPMAVMLGDYGCDDMTWLAEHAERPGTVTVRAHGRTFHLPIARFDNRQDQTTFVRADRATWKPADVKALHEGLQGALAKLAAAKK
jgi:hypothetical protein